MNRRTIIMGAIATAASSVAAPVVAMERNEPLPNERFRNAANRLREIRQKAMEGKFVVWEEGHQEIGYTTQRLFEIAQRQRVKLEHTVDVYANLCKMCEGSGLTNDNLLTFTESMIVKIKVGPDPIVI